MTQLHYLMGQLQILYHSESSETNVSQKSVLWSLRWNVATTETPRSKIFSTNDHPEHVRTKKPSSQVAWFLNALSCSSRISPSEMPCDSNLVRFRCIISSWSQAKVDLWMVVFKGSLLDGLLFWWKNVVCNMSSKKRCKMRSNLFRMNLLRCFQLGSPLFSTPEWEKKNRGSIYSVEDSLLFQPTIWHVTSNALASAGLCWYISDPTLSSHIKTKCHGRLPLPSSRHIWHWKRKTATGLIFWILDCGTSSANTSVFSVWNDIQASSVRIDTHTVTIRSSVFVSGKTADTAGSKL